MPILAEIYVAARTRNVEDADTDDLPVLVVRRASNIVFTKPLFGGSSMVGRGQSGVWRFDVRDQNLDSADLSIELHASGDDAWSPEHVISWGISGRLGDERVIPLGADLDLASPLTAGKDGIWISTDGREGVPVFFLTRVGRGQNATRARRIVVVSATDPFPFMFTSVGPNFDFKARGSNGPVTLQGGGAGRLFLSYTLPSSPQGDLALSSAGFYVADLAAPFSRLDCEGGAFTLTIESADLWRPDYFAVFGVDTTNGGPRVMIPFVAASGPELKQMSSDSLGGFHTAVLPTAKVLFQLSDSIDVDDLGGLVLAAARGVPHPEDVGLRSGAATPAVKAKSRRR